MRGPGGQRECLRARQGGQRGHRGGLLQTGLAVVGLGVPLRVSLRESLGTLATGRALVLALLVVVHKVAAGAVGAQADSVVSAAQLGLVLGVADQRAQLVGAVRELTLVAVLARARLLEGPAQLGLVARGVDVGGSGGGGRGRRLARRRGVGGLAVAAVELAVRGGDSGRRRGGGGGRLRLLLLWLLGVELDHQGLRHVESESLLEALLQTLRKSLLQALLEAGLHGVQGVHRVGGASAEALSLVVEGVGDAALTPSHVVAVLVADRRAAVVL